MQYQPNNIHCIGSKWPWGHGCPVAKTNSPAGTENPGKCRPISLLSAFLLERKYGQCLRLKCKIMSLPFQNMFNTNTRAATLNAKIPHEKNIFKLQSRKICSGVKYSKNCSVQLLDMFGFFLKSQEENWTWLQNLSVLMVYGMGLCNINKATSNLCQRGHYDTMTNKIAYNRKIHLGEITCLGGGYTFSAVLGCKYDSRAFMVLKSCDMTIEQLVNVTLPFILDTFFFFF